MKCAEIHSCPELMELIQKVGFLPLLDSGIRGYSAEDVVDEDCRYVVMDDGGWDWPLWKWKGGGQHRGGDPADAGGARQSDYTGTACGLRLRRP